MNSKIERKYHHGDLRVALIDATVEMLTQQGVESITMRSLSDWIGVSRTAAYRHFNDKTDLLTATAIKGFSLFTAELRATRIDESYDQLSRFKNMGKAYITFAMENPAYYRLMFGDIVTQKSEELGRSSDASFNELLIMLQQLQDAKIINDDDPKLQAVYIWSIVHGLSSLLIDNKLDPTDGLDSTMEYIDLMIKKGLVAK